jgi:eukaryotic-like serine/threonine-protein kinase
VNGRVLAGRYELGEVVGQGGMAVVYRATDRTLGREVALKVLREQYADDPEFVERFEREARSAARLAHPNVVDIYDVGSDDATHYIVMELVDGDSLKSLVRRAGALPPALVIRFGREVAAALEYAHRRGLIHRDVKPQNVLVDADGHAKLTDFGIARAAETVSLTQTGTVLGTAQYMSPEQARGQQLGPASDIYSLGVVLYELATGRLPFEGQSPLAVALRHVQDEPTPPRRLNPSLPPALELVVLRAMAKDPADRYASAAELAEALESGPDPIQQRTARAAAAPGHPGAGGASGVGLAAGATAVTRHAPGDGRQGAAVGRRTPAAAGRRRAPTAQRVILLLALLASLGFLALGFNWLLSAGRRAPQPTPTEQPAAVNTQAPTATRQAPTATPVPATATPAPTRAPTATPAPTAPPKPTATQAPTAPPKPTVAPPTAPSQTAPVPNVMGMSEAEARRALEAAGFKVSVEQIQRGPKGVVNDQSPEPGFRLPPGGVIKLAIGS